MRWNYLSLSVLQRLVSTLTGEPGRVPGTRPIATTERLHVGPALTPTRGNACGDGTDSRAKT